MHIHQFQGEQRHQYMHEHSFPGRTALVGLLTCCFNEFWALPVERPGSSEMDCWIHSANHTAKGMARRQIRHTGPWSHGPLTSKRLCWEHRWFLPPCHTDPKSCFLEESGEEEWWSYAVLLIGAFQEKNNHLFWVPGRSCRLGQVWRVT